MRGDWVLRRRDGRKHAYSDMAYMNSLIYQELPMDKLPNQFGVFQNRIMELLYANGWGSWQCHVDTNYPSLTFEAVCPHKQTCVHQISQGLFVEGIHGAEIAETIFQRMLSACKAHGPMLPPGQYLYTLQSAEPMGYMTYAGTLIDAQELKATYGDMVAKMQAEIMTKMEQYIWNAPNAPWPSSMAKEHPLTGLVRLFPNLSAYSAPCPVCKTASGPLGRIIPHINDNHQWTREQIADWLDTLDVDLTAKPQAKEEENAQPSPSPDEVKEPVNIDWSQYLNYEGIINTANLQYLKGSLGGY